MKLEMTDQLPSAEQLRRAQKHVKRLKSWYLFIPMNFLVTLTMATLSFLMYANEEPNTIICILMSGPLALWIIFIVEGVALHRYKTASSWEVQQIEKYMKRE